MMKRRIALLAALAAFSALAMPLREWDWHMPGEIYKNLEFTDRAVVDRAVKIFQQAVDAEWRNTKVTDLVPRYRAAASEWRKVQVQGEAEEFNAPLLAYAVFMQGYARQQARDRNEAIRLYNEVLDLYAEQAFVAVPTRYMLSRVYAEMGDMKRASSELDELFDDKAAQKHPLYYNALRDRGLAYVKKLQMEDAAECWEKILYSNYKDLNWQIREEARNRLIDALIVIGRYADLEKAIFATVGEDPKKRRDAIAGNAAWMGNIEQDWGNGVRQYLEAKYPEDKGKSAARKEALDKIHRAYAAWLDGEAGVFAGSEDAWSFSVACLRAHAKIDKPEQIKNRLKAIEAIVKNSKPDQINGRVRTLAYELLKFGQKDAARAACDMVKDRPYRLNLQWDVENELNNYKAVVMYMEEYVALQPAPADVNQRKYDLAWQYRHRVGQPEKAIKIYQELNDPPRSLWGLAETFRQVGKKKESYQTIGEIASVFPNEAANAILRTATWREQDGDKKNAIALFRRILSHPDWKKSNAASDAHQALERLGQLTGGAMTNEVR